MKLPSLLLRRGSSGTKPEVAHTPSREGFDAVLHIGAGKTGSSAIQAFIGDNLEPLGRLGFAVPSADFAIGRNASAAHVTPFEAYFAKRGAGLTQALEKMMARRGPRTVLMSAENLCENPGYLRDFCRSFNVKVILYVRRQDEYLESAWQQWHSKHRSDLAEWLDYMLGLDVIRWDVMVERWAALSGAANISPRVFERRRFPDGHVAKDFVAALGCGEASAAFTFRERDINASWSNILTSLVAGRTDLFTDVHDEAFYHWVGHLTGDRYAKRRDVSLISREQRERVLAHYAAGNEKLRAAYFADQSSLFAPLDHSLYTYADEIDLRAEQVRALMDVVASAFKARRK